MGLRNAKSCISLMGKYHRSGKFSWIPNMAFASAVKQAVIQRFHPNDRSNLVMLAA